MADVSYIARRSEIETYFDRTAVEAWKRLTSDAPLGRIRATVRAGRDAMRATLLSWMPNDLRGARVLDAGCGTGALAVEAAQRGAHVVAIDLSPKLVSLAAERMPSDLADRLEFRSGDMLDPSLGRFDYIVAMDSLIHYPAHETVHALARLGQRASGSMLFTFAPRTPLLTVMHTVGRLFPRGDRAPAIEPVGERHLLDLIAQEAGLELWQPARTQRIRSGFYQAQALELTFL